MTEYYIQTPERKFGTCTSLERQLNRLRDSKRERRPRHGGHGLRPPLKAVLRRQARTASRAGQLRTGRGAAPLRRELEAQPRERVTPAPAQTGLEAAAGPRGARGWGVARRARPPRRRPVPVRREPQPEAGRKPAAPSGDSYRNGSSALRRAAAGALPVRRGGGTRADAGRADAPGGREGGPSPPRFCAGRRDGSGRGYGVPGGSRECARGAGLPSRFACGALSGSWGAGSAERRHRRGEPPREREREERAAPAPAPAPPPPPPPQAGGHLLHCERAFAATTLLVPSRLRYRSRPGREAQLVAVARLPPAPVRREGRGGGGTPAGRAVGPRSRGTPRQPAGPLPHGQGRRCPR